MVMKKGEFDTNATSPYKRRYKQLQREWEDWRPHYKYLQDYLMPRQGVWLEENNHVSNKQDDGDRINQKIINSEGGFAVRTLASGFQSGMTSPARPWLRFVLPDKDLMQFGPVKEWLYRLQQLVLEVYSKCNFYQGMHSLYEEMAVFGTGAMSIFKDTRQPEENTIIYCRPYTCGEYYLGQGKYFMPNSLYLTIPMTAYQMATEFGTDNLSEKVKHALKAANPDKMFNVIHVIQPNDSFDDGNDISRFKRYESTYYELSADDPDVFLRQSGFNSNPAITPRWDVRAVSTYGRSPGMMALGDVRQLQKMEEKKLKGLDKMIDPPMNAPASMKRHGATIVPGGVNWIDTTERQQAFTPSYQIQPDFNAIAFEEQRVEERIRRAFYTDLFLSITGQDKDMTAKEVAVRQEEKLIMLGPTLQRTKDEALTPAIFRTLAILNDIPGMIPEPPQEMLGMELDVDYISILAQAQKIINASNMDATVAFVGNLAQLKPEALDKLNAYDLVDEYVEAVGAPPTAINTNEEAQEIADARAQQMALNNAQAQAGAAAETAKTMSDTPVNNPETENLLDRMLQGV